MAFHKDKDGTSLLTWLSTFAVGQGAALVAVLQSQTGREQFGLVMSLYIIFAVLTIVSIIVVLGWTVEVPIDDARKKEIPKSLRTAVGSRCGRDKLGRPVALDGGLERVLAYDQRTVRFGRMVLVFMILMTILFVILGLRGLLQGQTARVPFTGTKMLTATPPSTSENIKASLRVGDSSVGEELSHRLWFDARGLVPEADQVNKVAVPVLAVLTEPFEQNYETFCGIVYIEGHKIETGLAYLWKQASPNVGLASSGLLETLVIHKTSVGSALVDIEKPNKGDKLILLLKVPIVDKQPPVVQKMFISLTRR